MPFNAWHQVATGPNVPEELNVIIEIPRGSRNKYELDKETGLLRFDRLLYSSVHYSADYGFIPRTLADDNDPLDVLVMTTEPLTHGCLVVVRPIGVFEMSDDKGLDEKVLCVPVYDPLYTQFVGLANVAPHFLKEVEHFFGIYKELEGAEVTLTGWDDVQRAHEVIMASVEMYRKQ